LKTIALFSLLLFGFFGLITALARPDILQAQYSEIRAPIDKYFAGKNAQAWKVAKDAERAAWNMNLHLPADCGAPKTAIRELECRNKMKMHAQAFEQNWANKVRNGWRPEGIGN
jgi:hypothetical protein